jgi:hypothetical protein
MSTVNQASKERLVISDYKAENKKVISLLSQATTQEPKPGRAWTNETIDVVTFRQDGTHKGSLERFCEANKIGEKVYERLRAAVAAGAHKESASAGVVKFIMSKENLRQLQSLLDGLATSRDKSSPKGVLDGAEYRSFVKLDNGKAATATGASEALKKTKLGGNRTEHDFSRKANYVIDLLYSKGSITRGQAQVDEIARAHPGAVGAAIKQMYKAVSMYISRGQNEALSFICKDQRQEVTRGVMRTFGSRLDDTERLISAVKVPRGH